LCRNSVSAPALKFNNSTAISGAPSAAELAVTAEFLNFWRLAAANQDTDNLPRPGGRLRATTIADGSKSQSVKGVYSL